MSNKFISIVIPATLFVLLAASISLYSYRQIKNERVDIQPTPTATVPPPKPTIPSPPPLIEQKTLQNLTAEARADLAERLSISQAEMTTKQTQSVTWNDSSLGCPEPGMMYLQMLTPGYKILLEAQNQEYDYRASLRHVKLCANADQ